MMLKQKISKFLKWLVSGADSPQQQTEVRPVSAAPLRYVQEDPRATATRSTRPLMPEPVAERQPSRCPEVDPAALAAYWRGALDHVGFGMLNPAHKDAKVLLALPLHEVTQRATIVDDGSGKAAAKTKDVNVVLCLFVPSRERKKPRQCHALLAVPAILVDEENLAPRTDAAPVFNSNYLNPDRGKNLFAYAERDSANAALYLALKTMASDPGLDIGWPAWWETCTGVIRDLLKAQNDAGLLTRLVELAGESEAWELGAFAFEANGSGTREIKNVYNTLLASGKTPFPALYSRFCGIEQAEHVQHMPSAFHDNVVGHIDECDGADNLRPLFPLDDTQRMAVCAIVNLQVGQLQAVNGPPGSGKTSMLRAVVASRWVSAALNKEPCPIIIACGATNQSVTNVIEAFGKAPHPDDGLAYAQRWIPDLPSYGAYLPSSSVLKDEKKMVELSRFILLKRGTSTGFLYHFVDRNDALNPARALSYEEHYLGCARKVLGRPHLYRLEDAVPLVHQSLCNIEAERKRFAQLLATSGAGWQTLLESAISRSCHMWPASRIEQLQGMATRLQGDHRDTLAREGIMDLVWRAEAFHWAARYWEGRFLLAQRTRLLTRHRNNVEESLRRLCMIAPCLVSTLHSVPNFCEIDPDPTMPSSPSHQLGIIDLLVIDEAGQATPELAGAAIALARRAAVVGDLEQLAPIWNNTSLTEIAIAASAGATGLLDALKSSKRSVADGSTLGMARLLSRWREDGLGLTLRYHYRCKPSIIGFCNVLSYEGKLIPRTKEAIDFPEPAMAWVGIDKEPSQVGGSYQNSAEVQEMVDWVVERWPVWQKHPDTQGKRLSDIVALITAYRPQANLLRSRLDQTFDKLRKGAPDRWPAREDVTKVTIGTVHQLQGAERPIVCFSLVEGPLQSATSFIDRDASLLNVGISRAKRSFVIFANPDRLFPEAVKRYNREAEQRADVFAQLSATHKLGAYLLGCAQAQALYPKRLVIIEANGKQATLEEMLGKQSAVRATTGALFSLPWGKGVDVAAGFVPVLVEQENAAKFMAEADRILAVVDEIIIATDDDRMGEYIAWQAARLLGNRLHGKTVGRARLGMITRAAVTDALTTPGELDVRKVLAEATREVVDSLTSGRLSSCARTHMRKVDNAQRKDFVDAQICDKGPVGNAVPTGRVQAAILRLMLNQARSVVTSQDKRCIWAVFNIGNEQFHARLVKHSEGRHTAESANVDNILRHIADQTASTIGMPRKMSEVVSIPDAGTVSVMIEAWRRFKLAPWRTMEALQALYDGSWSRSAYNAEADSELDPKDPITPAAPRAGHPPVTPLDRTAPPELICAAIANPDWGKVYTLIWERHLSAESDPAKVRTLTYVDGDLRIGKLDDQQLRLRFEASTCTNVNANEAALISGTPQGLRHNDATRLSACWMMFNKMVPQYEVEAAQAWTLSYDSLLQLMQTGNIGRPSTCAATLKKMVHNGLISEPVDSGVLRLTPVGLAMALTLEKHEPELSSHVFSARLSQQLSLIESGEKGPRDVLGDLIPLLVPDCRDPDALRHRIWNSLPELELKLAGHHDSRYAAGLIGPDIGAIDA